MFPHFSECIEVQDRSHDCYLDMLYKIQKCMFKMQCGSLPFLDLLATHTLAHCFRYLRVFPMHKVHTQGVLLFMYKYFNDSLYTLREKSCSS